MTTPSIPPYRPAPYIIAASGLTEEQLMIQFESFKDSLPYSSVAPGLVFERILGNLFTAASGPQRSLDEQQLSSALSTRTKTSDENSDTQTGGAAAGDELQLIPTSNDATGSSHVLHLAVLKFTSFLISLGGTSYSYGVKIDSQKNDSGLYPEQGAWPDGYLDDIYNSEIGSYSTTEESRGMALLDEIDRKIEFSESFRQPPQVLVWFKGLHMRYGGTLKVRASVANRSAAGFTLCIRTSGKGILYSAGVMWLAREDSDLIESKFTVPVHALCQLTGTRPDHNIQTENLNLGQVFLVDEIVIEGEVGWPLSLMPLTRSQGCGMLNWRLDASANISGFCTLGVNLVLYSKKEISKPACNQNVGW